MTNEQRAEEARHTLRHFKSLGDHEDDVETLAIDLVADILHLLEQEGVDHARVLRTAEGHFHAEREEVL